MPRRELSRRQSRWGPQNFPHNGAGLFNNLYVRTLFAPGNERTDSSWRIDEIIFGADATGVVAEYIAAMGILFTTGMLVEDSDFSFGPAATPLQILFGNYPDAHIIGTGTVPSGGSVSEMDFHPVEVNANENLGIFFGVNNTFPGGAIDGLLGYSLSYTVISER